MCSPQNENAATDEALEVPEWPPRLPPSFFRRLRSEARNEVAGAAAGGGGGERQEG